MKRSELFFSAITVPLDYVVLVASAVIAYQIRYLDAITSIRPVVFDLKFGNFIILVSLFGLVWLIIFAIAVLGRIIRNDLQIERVLQAAAGRHNRLHRGDV